MKRIDSKVVKFLVKVESLRAHAGQYLRVTDQEIKDLKLGVDYDVIEQLTKPEPVVKDVKDKS